MNRYQQEVAELDRRHRLTVRLLTFVGAAAVSIAALWSAGLPPTVWLERAQALIERRRAEEARKDSFPAVAAIPAPAPNRQQLSTDSEALAGTDSSISPVPLQLLLASTSPGRNAREGTAALGVDLNNPQTYTAGALLANGARLVEIHAGYVLLKRDEESVRLYRQGADERSRNVSNALLLVGGAQAAPLPVVNTREIVTDYLRPSPVYDGEILQGYVVYPGARSGVFSQLGLQPGDVITALNDAPFTGPAQDYGLFQQLTEGVAMTAVVDRKGQVQRLTLDGSHIVADQERAKNTSATSAMVAGPP